VPYHAYPVRLSFSISATDLVPDKNATIWARFYDIETNKPFFSGRGGIKKGFCSALPVNNEFLFKRIKDISDRLFFYKLLKDSGFL
jgi:hypothetical protein